MNLKTQPRDPSKKSAGTVIKDTWLKPPKGSKITKFRWAIGLGASALLLGALLAANIVTTDYGFIPVGFGLEATAGTIFAGIMLASRDAVQDALGWKAVVALIAIGTALSFAVAAPAIAIAAALAFGVAELMNFAVYTPIRIRATLGDRKWALAVVLSNIAGAFTDSVVFLGVAFGASAIMPALPGQLVGKMWATIAYLIIGWTGVRVYNKIVSKRAAKAA